MFLAWLSRGSVSFGDVPQRGAVLVLVSSVVVYTVVWRQRWLLETG